MTGDQEGRARWAAVAVLMLVLATAFPFYWAIVSSFTPESQLYRSPSLVPTSFVLDHYRALFAERAFWVPIRNSLIVAGTTTAFCVTVGALCAYALARLRFRGKVFLLGLILAVSMFPQISVVSPLFLLLRALHLINTYPGLDSSVPHVRDAAHRLAAGGDIPATAGRAGGGGDGGWGEPPSNLP